jgi:hypothetical protein
MSPGDPPISRRSEFGGDESHVEAPGLDLIACDGCGRTFATEDGPGMIAAIVGPCPDCGGRFQLSDVRPQARVRSTPRHEEIQPAAPKRS